MDRTRYLIFRFKESECRNFSHFKSKLDEAVDSMMLSPVFWIRIDPDRSDPDRIK
jgi:hypothetical protein